MKKTIIIVSIFMLVGCSQVLKVQDVDKFKHDIQSKISQDKSKSLINDIESNIKKIKPAKPLTLKIKNILVEDFIALVFGEVLKYPYVLDRSVEQLQKRIDIEISDKMKADSLFPVVVSLLDSFGVDAEDINGVMLFTVKKSLLSGKNGEMGGQGAKDKDVKAPPANCVFSYKPRFSTAINLKLVIEKMVQNENSKVIVSEQNNKLIIRSTEKEKRTIVKLLQIIDEKQKLIYCDVTLAEVTMTGDLSIGLQGFLNSALGFNIGINANNGFGLTGSITAGDWLKAVLQIGEKRGLVKIKANPYLLIADGSESSIEIGSEYPILKSEALSSAAAGTIQNVEYRKTGIIISLKPVVAGSSVHLTANVEMSEGEKNTVSSINSPSILNRKIKFDVILLSDQALIVGGLVHEVKTGDDYYLFPASWGVPYGKSSIVSRSEIVLIVKIKVIEDDNLKNWFEELSIKYEAQKISYRGKK